MGVVDQPGRDCLFPHISVHPWKNLARAQDAMALWLRLADLQTTVKVMSVFMSACIWRSSEFCICLYNKLIALLFVFLKRSRPLQAGNIRKLYYMMERIVKHFKNTVHL